MYDTWVGVQAVNATLSYDSNATLSGELHVQYYQVCNSNNVRALGSGQLKLYNITDSRIIAYYFNYFVFFLTTQQLHCSVDMCITEIVSQILLAKCGL